MKRFLLILGFALLGTTLTAAPLQATAPPEPITVMASNYLNEQSQILVDFVAHNHVQVFVLLQAAPVPVYVCHLSLNELQHFYRPIIYEYVANDNTVIKVSDFSTYTVCSNQVLPVSWQLRVS